MRWAESDTCHFVKIYLGHNILWNPKNEEYKLKYKRLDAYKNVSSEFYDVTGIKLSQIEVRQKIKNIRGTYLQELVKIEQRSTATSPYKSNLKWFNDYHGCLEGLTRRVTASNQALQDDAPKQLWIGVDESDNINEDETNNDIDDYDDHDHPKDPFVSPADDDFIYLLKSEPEEESDVKAKNIQNSFKMKRRKFKRRNSSSNRSVQSSKDSTVSNEDEFDIYGKYIASQLRGMTLNKALRVQLHIQSIVSEARMEDN